MALARGKTHELNMEAKGRKQTLPKAGQIVPSCLFLVLSSEGRMKKNKSPAIFLLLQKNPIRDNCQWRSLKPQKGI